MNYQRNYYSVSNGTTALKICHDTDHQKVGEQHIGERACKFNSFEVTVDLPISKIAN